MPLEALTFKACKRDGEGCVAAVTGSVLGLAASAGDSAPGRLDAALGR